VSYASVLQSEPVPDLPSPSYEAENIQTSLPSKPWKPSIIVVPLETQLYDEISPQSSQTHLQQEQYWRAVQSEQQKNISRLLTVRSKDGIRSIPSVCHDIQQASLIASKHALLARNPGLLIRIDESKNNNNSLLFCGFNENYISTSISRNNSNSFEFKIDFHGVDVRNSIQFLNSILCHMSSTSSKFHSRKIIIHLVVGRGSHSQGGIPKLKPAIKSFLQRKGYKLSILESEITLHL
jgi:hypothetical protein